MKPHRIIKSFDGSQNGHDSHHFAAGTTRDLSDSLAAIVVKEGWAKPCIAAAEPPKSAREQDDETPATEAAEDAPETEEKSLGDAPENKMKKAAPENKSKK